MSSIQIDGGIPIPTRHHKNGEGKYPFGSMQVGDSFLVRLDGRRSWSFIYQAIYIFQNKSGRKFITRVMEDGSRRIWRIA